MPRFFLVKGKAGIYYGEKLVVVIEEGSYFGEIGCIMGGIRRAGVKALTTCELQALSRRNLNTLLGEYPEVGDELKQVARDRASKTEPNLQMFLILQVLQNSTSLPRLRL
jgi:CRP-like cAMP-binding protein